MFTLNCEYQDDYKSLVSPYIKTGYGACLIQVFTHHCNEEYINMLIKELTDLVPDAVIIGSTTDGEVLSDEVKVGTTVLSFSFFEETRVELYSATYETETLDSFEKGVRVANSVTSEETKVVISFADGLNTNADEFLQGFSSVKPNVVLAGGLAGDSAMFSGTYVFTNRGIAERGTVAVALEGEGLHAVSDYGFGWIPIGKIMYVTESKKNHVFTIDNKPAAEVYSKYLGEEAGKQLPAIGIEFPLIIKENQHNIARAVLARLEDDSLLFAGNIPQGSEVYFGVGEVNEILSGSKRLVDSLNENPVESIFAYSCMARRRFLGKNASLEFEVISKMAPVAGFCTYGEFYHNESRNYLLNQSTTLLGLWEESSKSKKSEKIDTQMDVSNYSLGTLRALTNLINVVANELSDANQEIEEKSKMMLMQSRLSAMGEMVGNIAHQWRQPLNSLGLNIQDIEDAYEFGELDGAYLESFTEKSMFQINYMSKTIDDFRNFLKPSSSLSKIDVAELFGSVENLLSGLLQEHDISLNVEVNSKKYILGDSSELVQVLVNIINNAKDALLEKKIIKKRVSLKFYDDKEDLFISICDNAGGIPEELLEKIFEPYFTTKAQMHGSGLGLYMSKMIVQERMDGEISVVNEKEGACFRFKLAIDKEL